MTVYEDIKNNINQYIFLYIVCLVFSTSNDFTQDLGRHLKLGELIIKTKNIPKINLFSYTNPNFPFLNHHWLSEVIFFLLSQIFGLNSLIILKLGLIFFSLAVVFKLALTKSSFVSAVLAGLVLSPLILERNGIRPEIFGYFFFSIILYILFTYPKNKKLIYFLPLIMVLWINIHISFVFGIFSILLLIIKACLPDLRGQARLVRIDQKITFFLIFSLAILFVNPHGLKGVFYPFNIFQNYGYTIVENQSLFYLSQATFNPLIKYFFFISPLIVISLIILIFSRHLTRGLLLLTFFMLTILQIRHLPFFILVAIPAVSQSINLLIDKIGNKWLNISLLAAVVLVFINIGGIFFFVNNRYYLTFDNDKRFGIGYINFGDKAIDFIYNNNLQNNIFNNFDIGGYLIYKLYPKYKIFIDNRPEAYPAEFVENIYKQLQIEPTIQEKFFKRYQIKTVIFGHTDQTQWGEIFASRILKDKNWRLVYLDPSIFILTADVKFSDIRDNKGNLKRLIDKENNYLNLLRLSRVFGFIEEKEMVQAAFDKARELNPDSCSIKKNLYNYYLNNLSFYFYKASQLKNSSWYCF